MNRNIVLALVASFLFCCGFEAAAWNNSVQMSVPEKDEGFQARVIDFLLDRLVGQMTAKLPLPSGDCILTGFSVDDESVVSLNKVVKEDIYSTLNIEETKSNIFYSFLKFPQQSTPLILLCIESDRNMIYRYYDKSKEKHKDVNITVEELKELLGVKEVDNERRKKAFSDCFSIFNAPFTASDGYCVLTTKLDMRFAEVPDEAKVSEDDYRNMLIDGIRTKADNSLFTAIALYLRLGLKDIFIDEVGDNMVLSEPYSSLVDIFNKAQETQDVGEVPPVPVSVAVPEGETIVIDDDSDEPVPLQLVETKPLFEGKRFLCVFEVGR